MGKQKIRHAAISIICILITTGLGILSIGNIRQLNSYANPSGVTANQLESVTCKGSGFVVDADCQAGSVPSVNWAEFVGFIFSAAVTSGWLAYKCASCTKPKV